MRRITPPAAPEPVAVALRDAPGITGLSRSTIYREAAAGRLVLLKRGRAVLLCMASVRAYLAALPRVTVKLGAARDAG